MTADALATQSNSLATQTITDDARARQGYAVAILMRTILTRLHDVAVAASLVATTRPWSPGASLEVGQADGIERTMREVYAQYVVNNIDPIDNLRAVALAAQSSRVLWIRFNDLASELSASLKRIA